MKNINYPGSGGGGHSIDGDSQDDDDKEDEKQIDSDICIINKKEQIHNQINNNMNYENFLELKNKIFYIFENNSSNKEKEKIINLLKQNYNYENFVNNKNTNGKK